MTVGPDLRSLMASQVGIQKWTGLRDAYGNRTYGVTNLYFGRVVQKRQRVVNVKGFDVISESTIYLDTVSGISIEDRIVMPSGFLPANPPIIQARLVTDERGPHHTVLLV